jgi:hypothetical protein
VSVEAQDAPPAAVHVDLDGARHIFRAHGWTWDGDDDPLFESGLRGTLEVLERLDVCATLFVIAEDLDDPRKAELIREALRRGHSIASHSTTHRKLSTLSADDKRAELFGSRERLQDALGCDVRGFRAPGFDLDEESYRLIGEAGYAYDSSVFPDRAFAARIGVDGIPQAPHRPLSDRPLWELPLPAHRPLPFPFHASYSLVFGMWYFRLGLSRFRRAGAPLVLLFHLTDFADPLPAGRLGGAGSKLFTLSHLSGAGKRRRCETMLREAGRRFRLTDTETLLREVA